MEFTSSHKYIKNTSTNGTILTENLLNTNRGPWTPKRTRQTPMQLGRIKESKEKKRKRKVRIGPATLGGKLKDKRGSWTHRSPLTGGETVWNRKGASGAWRSMQQTVCGRQDRVRPTQMAHVTALHTPA